MKNITEIIKSKYSNQLKQFGQNFLICEETAQNIVANAQITNTDTVVEIGPGPGILTRYIAASKPQRLITVDIDDRSKKCIEQLKSICNLEIITTDALDYNIREIYNSNSQQSSCIKIIGNLPYNISTALLTKWLKDIDIIKSMTLMFQKEVALRICSSPNSKKFGWLSVYVQSLCEAENILEVPKELFTPIPKVDSSVVYITPKYKIPSQEVITALKFITQKAFSMRRKKIKTTLKGYFSNLEKTLETMNINPSSRAEQLNIEDFIELAKKYLKQS